MLKLTKSEIKNVAIAAASSGKNAYSTLDYSGVKNVGDMADYSVDLFGVVIGKQAIPVVTLDPAKDTPDTLKARDTLRKRVLSNLTRNARNTFENDKARLALYWADVPTGKDGETRRAVVIERTA